MWRLGAQHMKAGGAACACPMDAASAARSMPSCCCLGLSIALHGDDDHAKAITSTAHRHLHRATTSTLHCHLLHPGPLPHAHHATTDLPASCTSCNDPAPCLVPECDHQTSAHLQTSNLDTCCRKATCSEKSCYASAPFTLSHPAAAVSFQTTPHLQTIPA